MEIIEIIKKIAFNKGTVKRFWKNELLRLYGHRFPIGQIVEGRWFVVHRYGEAGVSVWQKKESFLPAHPIKPILAKQEPLLFANMKGGQDGNGK